MGRISRQKSNKEIEDLNDTANEVDLRNISTTLHSLTGEYTFFSRTHGNSLEQTIC